MKIIKLLAAAFFAVLAFSAIGATSAFAVEETLPAFLSASGKVFPVKFGGAGLGNAELNTPNTKIVCSSTLILGEILPQPSSTHSMLGDVHFLFHKCFDGLEECETTGQPKGLIETPLYLFHIGRLLTLSNGNKDVLIAIKVTPATTFNCGLIVIKVTGNLVGLIPEVGAGGGSQFNAQKTELLIGFTQSAAGTQSFTKFEYTLPITTIEKLELTAEIGGLPEKASEVAAGDVKAEPAGETVELKVP